MSDQTIVEGGNPSTPRQLGSPQLKAKPSARNESIRTAIGLCTLALIGSFFLPWIKIFFSDLSGYQLQQLPGDMVKLLWVVPGAGFLALVAALANQEVANASQLAGVMPFFVLAYYRMKLGENLLEAIEYGGYVTLGLGLLLFVLPRFLTKPKRS